MKSFFVKSFINNLTWSLAVITTFFTQYISYLQLKGQGCSCKIDCFMGNYISKLKGAWQAQFLGHTLVTLKNSLFFEDVQMMLLWLFDIYTGFKSTKIWFLPSVQLALVVHVLSNYIWQVNLTPRTTVDYKSQHSFF